MERWVLDQWWLRMQECTEDDSLKLAELCCSWFFEECSKDILR